MDRPMLFSVCCDLHNTSVPLTSSASAIQMVVDQGSWKTGKWGWHDEHALLCLVGHATMLIACYDRHNMYGLVDPRGVPIQLVRGAARVLRRWPRYHSHAPVNFRRVQLEAAKMWCEYCDRHSTAVPRSFDESPSRVATMVEETPQRSHLEELEYLRS